MNAAQTARRNSPHRRKKGPDYKKIAIAGVILIILIACISLAMKFKGAGEANRKSARKRQPGQR